jgi:predicted aspartyl protease
MKAKISVILLLFFLSGCLPSRKHETPPMEKTEEIAQVKKPTFFISVPITKFSAIQCPCVEVEIEDTTFTMALDLGFQGNLAIAQDLIDQISLKTFIRTKPMYGIRGKQYPTNLYSIPKIKIGAMSFTQPILEEETAEFIKDGVFVENGGEPSPTESGRLGWELFYYSNLLIDIKNSKIAFCDSLDTLQTQGYAIETFIRTPLFLENDSVEFEARTPGGILRCILDTGATWNFLNSEVAGNKPIEQAMWDSDNLLEYSSFQIAEDDFGAITFHRIPITVPVQVEAFVGMEFFRDHLVFLDFSGGYVYFAKDHRITAKTPDL